MHTSIHHFIIQNNFVCFVPAPSTAGAVELSSLIFSAVTAPVDNKITVKHEQSDNHSKP
jgi:hypothetical protein